MHFQDCDTEPVHCNDNNAIGEKREDVNLLFYFIPGAAGLTLNAIKR